MPLCERLLRVYKAKTYDLRNIVLVVMSQR